jgi:steroid delta-isomerase-like uncharacterized protein
MSSLTSQPNVETDTAGGGLAGRYLAAWSRHDALAVAAFMTDDVDFEDVTLGERLHGKSAVADFVERFTNTFSSDYHFELVSELTTTDRLAVEWTVYGHHDRDSAAMPATHKPFTIRGVTIARLDKGKLSASRDYWDMAGFLRDVGVLES